MKIVLNILVCNWFNLDLIFLIVMDNVRFFFLMIDNFFIFLVDIFCSLLYWNKVIVYLWGKEIIIIVIMSL